MKVKFFRSVVLGRTPAPENSLITDFWKDLTLRGRYSEYKFMNLCDRIYEQGSR